jgi:crossover junction endodeoxyribonuclease RusA
VGEAITLELPLPPSVNHYWLAGGRGRRFISPQGKLFRDLCCVECKLAGSPTFVGDVAVTVFLYLADNRKRDADNCLKCVLDSLQHAGVFVDDEQVVKLTVCKRRFPNNRPGVCVVNVSDAPVVSTTRG